MFLVVLLISLETMEKHFTGIQMRRMNCGPSISMLGMLILYSTAGGIRRDEQREVKMHKQGVRW